MQCFLIQNTGFHVDNTIGATHQPNLPWIDSWAEFWDQHRLGHMLKLTGDAGLSKDDVSKLRQKTKELLSHNPEPSLIHGDLWGGNKGFAKNNDDVVVPVIFDPATYYGDREADIAMTKLFGGFSEEFYSNYNNYLPMINGWQERMPIWNLYPLLVHANLFGSSYLNQINSILNKYN